MSSAARRPSSVWSGGIRMSVTTTSGRSAGHRRTSASASPTAATTSTPLRDNRRASPSRRRAWSSPITTRTAACPQPGPAVGEVGDVETAAQRLDAVARPAQSAVPPTRAPPQPSSRTSMLTWASVAADQHDQLRGAGVLDGVGERLGDDEVGRALHDGRQVVGHPDVDGGGDGQPVGEVLDRRLEPVLDEHRGHHPVHQLPELVDGRVEPGEHLARRRVDAPGGLQPQQDQPGLDAVVQVAGDAAAFGVGRRGDAGAGGTQLRRRAVAGRARWR